MRKEENFIMPERYHTAISVVFCAILLLSFNIVGKTEAEASATPAKTAVTNDVSDKNAVALVNGVPISRKRYEHDVNRIIASERAKGKTLTQDELEQMRQSALNILINREILYQKSVESGLVIDDAQVSEQIASVKARLSKEEYRQHLENLDMDEQAFAEHTRKMIANSRFLDIRFRQTIEIPETEARRFFDDHPEIFRPNDEVKTRHILIKFASETDTAAKNEALNKINALKAELNKGADFGTLAAQHSEGPDANKGGDLGFIKRGQMVKSFEDVAFSLSIGQISDPVETSHGYHLIQVTERKEGPSVDFNTVKARIIQNLTQQQISKEVFEFIEAAKQEADIQIFLP